MKPLRSVLVCLPLLASCKPIVRDFEPQISGAPIRTHEARIKLETCVAEVASRHGLWENTPRHPSSETLLEYAEPSKGQTGYLYFELTYASSTNTYRIKLTDYLRFRRSNLSKEIERDVLASLH